MNIISKIDNLLCRLQTEQEITIEVENPLIKDINELANEGLVILKQASNNEYRVELSLKGAMFIEEGGYKNVFHKKRQERKYNFAILICYIVTALGGMTTALIAIFK